MKQEDPKRAARLIASGCVALRVRRLGRMVTRIYDGALAPHGINISQLNLLAAISIAGGARQVDLGRFLELEKSTLSRDLKRMEQLGWIQSKPLSAGRGQAVVLTPAGARLLEEVEPAWEKAQRAARSQLGKTVFAQLRNLMAPPV
jgi:DNA-binding MarR family transcriptional regulator